MSDETIEFVITGHVCSLFSWLYGIMAECLVVIICVITKGNGDFYCLFLPN